MQFEEFIAPYYRELTPKAPGVRHYCVHRHRRRCHRLFLMMDVGIGLPLERMAGVDVVQLRRDHPGLRMIGAFDKATMHLGEARMRQEFERLLPVMRTGGFIPSVDHQTPPEVSLEDYRLYRRLMDEYTGQVTGEG
jgi:hypothetical protein